MPSAGVHPSSGRGSGDGPSLSGPSSDRRSRIRPVVVLPTALFAETATAVVAGYERVCENCAATFTAKRPEAKTCCSRCRRAVYERRHAAD